MHPLLQCPHRVYSSLAAREPFQNQVSSRHQRILTWVVLSVAGVPGITATGGMSHCTDPVQILKSVPSSLQKPSPSRPVHTPHSCYHLKSDQSPSQSWTNNLTPHIWKILTFHIHCLWHRLFKFSHHYGKYFFLSFIRNTCIIGNFCCIILLKPEMIISSRKTNLWG